MAVDETHEPAEADDDAVELPADEPGTADEPGPSDDEQEAEADDDEQAPEPEPEPVAQGTTPEQWEARFKKIEGSWNTYTRAVEKQLAEAGDDYFRCPLCLGDTPGFLNRGQAGRFPDEQADLVKHVLGLARPVTLKQSKRYTRCAECDGHGKVATASQVPGNEDIKCEDCDGWGFTPPPSAPRNGQAPPAALPTLAAKGSPDIENPDPDGFGQPRYLPDGRDNPNWMRMPSAWVEVHPFGKTVGLTPQSVVPGGGS